MRSCRPLWPETDTNSGSTGEATLLTGPDTPVTIQYAAVSTGSADAAMASAQTPALRTPPAANSAMQVIADRGHRQQQA